MSDTLTTLSLVTLAQEYRGDVLRQVNRKTATLKMIKMVAGSGKNISWAPEFDGAIAETYSEGADQVNFGGDAQNSAVLQWGLYRSAIHVTSLAMDGAVGAPTPGGNRQLWARHLVNASGKLASFINQDIFAGDGTGTHMTGLNTAVEAQNTYATIDRTQTANALWNSTVIEPGVATALTFALIRDDLRKIYEASGETPDMAATTPAVFNKVGALFDATRRQIESVNGGNGPVKLEFGFQALEVDGTVFFKDKDATPQTVYYLNSDYIYLEYLPSAPQEQLIKAMGTIQPDDGFGPVPLGFVYEMLAKTGAADKAMVRWSGNLVVKKPNAFGKRTNVVDT